LYSRKLGKPFEVLMRRRTFLQSLSATAVAIPYFSHSDRASTSFIDEALAAKHLSFAEGPPDISGYTFLTEFSYANTQWKAYEDLRIRDGAITFVSSDSKSVVLRKSAEATFAEANPPYLGLKMDKIGLAGADLLADKLLESGDDPDPERVKAAAPPLGSAHEEERWRLPWNTFVGTKECSDTMPVFPSGNTRTYHPIQFSPTLTNKAAQKRFEGLVGGWTPAVRKVFPVSDNVYEEVVVFGDVEVPDKFIVQTWHRTARIENGKITKVVYGYSYPDFPPARSAPEPAQFYRALLVFAGYWERQLRHMSKLSLPVQDWTDMTKHAVVRELMVRPGGVYPKYGAVDRDYYGSEYDGFQDIFTSSVYTNLEWGRFEQARLVIDNYFSDFVDDKGMVNMRGPETAQFGMTLSLLARYFRYTKDAHLLEKHRAKVAATAELLIDMQEESLRLPADNPGHGLIHGWSESDSCLMPTPMTWWLPYYANSAFASRGLRDIARVWPEVFPAKDETTRQFSEKWLKQSTVLQDAVVQAIQKNTRHDMNPPYIGTYPGPTLTFRESMAKERPSPQGWPHRPYAELLQADILPAEMANLVINCMRAYGATTLGVVANVIPARAREREILGFISYGYAQMLLRLDRIEEYLLFLYSHRYHDHTRGSWTAGEVSSIDGSTAIFCIPAQQTIPLLVRWMLVLEDSDEERLYLAKAVPRAWLASGKEIAIEGAPTRWGKVALRLKMDGQNNRVTARVELQGHSTPKELHVKLRVPKEKSVKRATVNGKAAILEGTHKDTVIVSVDHERAFEIIGETT
jgi:hypothetical protein